MKVLIVSFEYKPIENGITISLERIARNLSEKNEVHIICYSGNSKNNFHNHKKQLTSGFDGKVRVHRISPFSGNMQYPSPQEISDMVYYIQYLDKKYNFDIIHGFRLIPGGYAAVIAAKLLGKKCVVSIRGNDIGRNVFDTNLFAVNKYVLENADKLTFVASDLLDLANTVVPISSKSFVIHNSFDIKAYSYIEGLKMPKLSGKVIGMSGIIRSKKGFVYAWEAFEKYRANNEATFFLVGDFQEEESCFYTNLIEKSKFKSSFIKTGVIKHEFVLNYMKLFDVFLLPSLTEGCSNAMLEAMYLKIPIIATDVGAASDIIDKKVLIEPRNNDAIYNLLKSNDGINIVDKLFSYYETNLKPSNEMKKWLDVYSK